MPAASLQEYLFKRIRESLPADVPLAEADAQTLFISADSAYRRIRGETLLVLDEAQKLCEAYQISFDEILGGEDGKISFQPFRVDGKSNSFEAYLAGIFTNLKHLSAAGDKKLIYLTKDIPVFYHLLYRPLADFHYFFWMKSILQHPDFAEEKFSMDLMPQSVMDMGWEIMKVYRDIPSMEIWNTEVVNSTISQIEYYREAGYFRSNADADAVHESLAATIEHVRAQAEFGVKFLPGENPKMRPDNLQFFYNRIVLADNTVLAIADGKKIVYINHAVLNYMATGDVAFCDETYANLLSLMKRATLLSQTGDKQRNLFFNILLRKIPVPLATQNNEP